MPRIIVGEWNFLLVDLDIEVSIGRYATVNGHAQPNSEVHGQSKKLEAPRVALNVRCLSRVVIRRWSFVVSGLN